MAAQAYESVTNAATENQLVLAAAPVIAESAVGKDRSERPDPSAVLSTRAADPASLRRLFGCYPSGVIAIAGLQDAGPVGIAASSFTSVSFDPPLVSVCAQNTSATWPALRGLPRLGISVLEQGQETTCRALAAKQGDRFSGTAWDATPSGAVFVHRATGWLECSIHHEFPAGDHSIVVLRVHAHWAAPDGLPLVFHASRYRLLFGQQDIA